MKKDKENNKINFFKKMYISIFKINEYEKLSKDGLKKALGYIVKIAFIVGIICSILIVIKSADNAKKLKEYLANNLPNFSFQDNLLNIETENKVILDNELLKVNIGGRMIIDVTTQKDILINEYKNDNEISILATKDKLIVLNSEGNTKEYEYQDVFKRYFEGEITTFNKEELLNIFNTIPYDYYLLLYTLSYFITVLIITLAYGLIISLLVFIIYKIQKKKVKFIEIFTMGLYSLTIFIIGYTFISFIPFKISSIIQIVLLTISVIYLVKAASEYSLKCN